MSTSHDFTPAELINNHNDLQLIYNSLLTEMREYAAGVNVDRLVSFAALVAFMRIQQSNRGYAKRVIMDDAAKNLQKSENLFKLNRSPFRHMGGKRISNRTDFKKPVFKNLK